MKKLVLGLCAALLVGATFNTDALSKDCETCAITCGVLFWASGCLACINCPPGSS